MADFLAVRLVAVSVKTKMCSSSITCWCALSGYPRHRGCAYALSRGSSLRISVGCHAGPTPWVVSIAYRLIGARIMSQEHIRNIAWFVRGALCMHSELPSGNHMLCEWPLCTMVHDCKNVLKLLMVRNTRAKLIGSPLCCACTTTCTIARNCTFDPGVSLWYQYSRSNNLSTGSNSDPECSD